ncbi:MAG TPA: menaquinone biosynthesis protein [Chthoniobacteraceae bacterium]|nr:menaquinone biosynthesis protein [Chthoniobacteraceae bacterium]
MSLPHKGGADPLGALRELRIGCVRYLNARPLIGPYEGPVRLEHPSVLAEALVRGELDAALVPVYEGLRSPRFLAVDGVAIAADGPVWSVFVAHRGPVGAIRRLALDPASLTSVNLCRVLFAEWEEKEPVYVTGDEEAAQAEGRLLIGNQANAFRQVHGAAYEYLDFGETWKRRTGLPFVFAVWLLRPELPDPERYGDAFRAMAEIGQREVERYVAEEPGDPAFTRRYLTRHIRYGLGAREKAGLAEFYRLLIKHGRLEPVEGAAAGLPLRWV